MPHHHCNRPKSVHHPHSSIDDDEWSSKNLTMYATFLKSICQSAVHLQSQCKQSWFLSKYLSATHNNKAHLRKYISTTSSLLSTIQSSSQFIRQYDSFETKSRVVSNNQPRYFDMTTKLGWINSSKFIIVLTHLTTIKWSRAVYQFRQRHNTATVVLEELVYLSAVWSECSVEWGGALRWRW